ncbi:MAG: hypothetical protein QM644_21220 [Mobilitalea sp.]
MKAHFDEDNKVFSLNTDKLPAKEDQNALIKISEIAARINKYKGENRNEES